MKRLSHPILTGFLLVLAILRGQMTASAAPLRLEASFTISGLATDPFDYAVTDVQVLLAMPDGATNSLPAFYDGSSLWRVRFSPGATGIYAVAGIRLNGQPIAAGNLQPASWTVPGPIAAPAFIQVDPANPRHFITSEGNRFFPIGHNNAWDVNSATNVAGIFFKMGAAHENWSRVWMNDWDNKNLDWPKVGGTFGQLNLTVARKWDAIVSAAEQADLHFQMTLQYHGQYSTAVDPEWSSNPYNTANGGFLSDPKLFFTDSTAKALTRRKLRYAIARWGYSPAIMAWELFNEVQFTDAGRANQWSTIGAWHDEMAAFLKSQDPWRHLVTTSSLLDQPIWDQTSYYQHHDYPTDLIGPIRDAPDITPGQTLRPVFGGECGLDFTPHLGPQSSLWAGLMAAQSGGEQPWYWDVIDANNDYPLFRSAADFVTRSGLADQDSLTKSAPAAICSINSSLVFSPGGGFVDATQSVFAVGQVAPDGIGTLPRFLQGNFHRSMTPNGYSFIVNYTQPGTFSVQVIQYARSGATLVVTVDGGNTHSVDFPAAASDVTTNTTLTVNIPVGQHTVKLINSGQDWLVLGNLTLDPYVPIIGAYAISNPQFAALWLWHRTNLVLSTASAAVTAQVPITGLLPGTYSGTWWDTLADAPISNITFFSAGTNSTIMLDAPPVLHSLAFYAGLPPSAGIQSSNLTRTTTTNSPPSISSLIITNSGGLPLSWSLSVTGASPIVYRAVDSTQPGGPVFAWKDISAVGNDITSQFAQTAAPKAALDEGIAGPIDIGFAFPFFSGTQSPGEFTQLYISPNGFVSFNPFAGDTSGNTSIPSAQAPSNSIAFFWDDLDASSAGHIYTDTDPIAGTFTLQLNGVRFKGTSLAATCQLILKPTGEILIQYLSVARSNQCTVGLQNAARDQGLSVAFNQNIPGSNYAMRITPTPWFRASDTAGFVTKSSKQRVDLYFDPAGIPPGDYKATLLISTGDPGNPPTALPIELNVLSTLSPIESWRLANFGSPSNSGPGADTANPDNDSLVNFIEYALGLDPHSANPDAISFSIVNNHLQLTYHRPHPAPADIEYIPEVTSGLGSGLWNSGPAYTSQTVTDNGDGTENVRVIDSSMAGSSTAHFIRIRFQSLPP